MSAAARAPAGVGSLARAVAGTPRPPVAILCGGRGARLQERTQEIPKPLVEIGGQPILWHVIALYAAQGFTRFLLATGYRGRADRALRRAGVLARGGRGAVCGYRP